MRKLPARRRPGENTAGPPRRDLTIIVAVITAMAALGSSAAAAYALVYTSESVQATRDQLRIIEQGQITERYGRAVEQLGDDTIDVRVGGIFALERITRDSPPDQPTIIEVLAAFVREHTAQRVTPPLPDSVGAERLLPAAPADIQAALTVIGRRDPARDGNRQLNLSHANLSGADLSDAYLARAELEGVDLTGAIMFRTNLTGAHLLHAKLSFAACRWANFTDAGMVSAVLINAFLYDATLTNAGLQYADLTDVFLAGANLTGAKLEQAKLTNASLSHTNFTNADLTGADLTGVNLSEANLTGAKR